MRDRISIQAVRLVYHDDSQACRVLRTVGYRAIEGGEWHGPTRKTVRDARADALERKAETAGRADGREAVSAHKGTGES